MYRIFGLAPQQFAASYEAFLEHIHEDDRQKVTDAVNAALVNPENPYSVEHRVVRPEGEVRWVQETGEISYKDNKPVKMLGIVHDITERKKAELVVRTYQEELETRVEERTVELSSANAQLQQLDNLKSMFIASMSHELRTPLNSIIGFTGVMLKGMSGELNEIQTDQLGRVQYSARHLLTLISDIIDISKIEAGRVDTDVEEINLLTLLGDILSNIDKLLLDRGNSIINKIDPHITLISDRTRLSQVLLNILNNAAKYTEQGTITIQTGRVAEKMEIIIEDTGVGMSEENLKKLFTPFERFDNSLSVQAGGTGLGLYLTKKLLDEVLQGSIHVESTFNKGTRIVVTIPKCLDREKNGDVMSQDNIVRVTA